MRRAKRRGEHALRISRGQQRATYCTRCASSCSRLRERLCILSCRRRRLISSAVKRATAVAQERAEQQQQLDRQIARRHARHDKQQQQQRHRRRRRVTFRHADIDRRAHQHARRHIHTHSAVDMTGPVLQRAAREHAHTRHQQPTHTDAQVVCCATSVTATAAPMPSSTMSAWLRKLRHHGDAHCERATSTASAPCSVASSSTACGAAHRTTRKQSSFFKTLFHAPHESNTTTTTESHQRHDHHHDHHDRRQHKQPESSGCHGDGHCQHRKQSRHHSQQQPHHDDQQNRQQQSQKERVAPPVQIPSTYMGRDFHGTLTVGGRRVPFTLEAHRQPRKKSSKTRLASISETHAVSALSSASMQAYRSRAYYQPPGTKRKDKGKDKR